jgi:hypothetical protein
MPMLIQNADGTFEAFILGSDHSLQQKSCDATGTWGEWQSRGGWHREIAVAAHKDRRIEVFTLGAKNELWSYRQKAASGKDWEWLTHGDGWWGRIAVAPLKDGRLRLFALGAANEPWTLTQKVPNGDWEDKWVAPGGWWGPFEIAANKDGGLQVAAIGSKNELWSYRLKPDGGWDPSPKALGGWWSDVGIAPNEDGRLQLFLLGSQKELWTWTQKSADGDWEDKPAVLGGVWRSFAVVTQPNQTIAVYALAAEEGDLWALRQSTPNAGFDKWQRVEVGLSDDDLKRLEKARATPAGLPGPLDVRLEFRDRPLPAPAKKDGARASEVRVMGDAGSDADKKTTQEKERRALATQWASCGLAVAATVGAATKAVVAGIAKNVPGVIQALAQVGTYGTSAGLICNDTVKSQQEYNSKWGEGPGVKEVMSGVDTTQGPWDRTV